MIRSIRSILCLGLPCLADLAPGPALAQDSSQPEIVAARELFRQGTEDADGGRFAQALEKFKRVAAVKETAAVRFNIARCEESLEKTGAALADFELAEREAQQDPKGDDVAKLAHERVEALRPRVPRLLVAPPSPAPDGMTVSLDGSRLAVATLGVPLPVNPGAHVLEATAPGRQPFHADVSVASGESKTFTLTLAPLASPDPDPAAEAPSSSAKTWGYVSIGVGAASGVAALAFLFAHNGAVSDIVNQCPNDRCPDSKRAAIASAQSSANVDEALSIAFAGLGAAGVGLGVYLVLTAPSPASAAPPPQAVLLPGAPGAPAGLSLRASF